VRLLHATYNVSSGAMENDGNVRASWRKLDPGRRVHEVIGDRGDRDILHGEVLPPSWEMDRRSTACLFTLSSQTT